MNQHPKPRPKVKLPKPRKARVPLPRPVKKMERRRRIKYGNAYTRPEWRKKVAGIRKRSRGICEARIRCSGAPVEGDPHHRSYLTEFKGWKRLMVPDDQLVDCCRNCHLEFERRKSAGEAQTTPFVEEM